MVSDAHALLYLHGTARCVKEYYGITITGPKTHELFCWWLMLSKPECVHSFVMVFVKGLCKFLLVHVKKIILVLTEFEQSESRTRMNVALFSDLPNFHFCTRDRGGVFVSLSFSAAVAFTQFPVRAKCVLRRQGHDPSVHEGRLLQHTHNSCANWVGAWHFPRIGNTIVCFFLANISAYCLTLRKFWFSTSDQTAYYMSWFILHI